MYFESHAHYDDPKFDTDRDELLSKLLPEAGVTQVINVGSNMKSSAASVELASRYDYIHASVGVHPHEAKSLREEDLAALEGLCRQSGVVAVGEIGLDFFYDFSDREIQRQKFREQLEIAKNSGLPVIIHSREACQETFDIVKESGVCKNGGVIHCFGGSAEMAANYVKLGFYIGFGGMITFPKVKTAVLAAQAVPLSRILIETDCPYLSPEPNRGKRNDSRNLKYICQKLAEIKGVSHEAAAQETTRNAETLFLNRR